MSDKKIARLRKAYLQTRSDGRRKYTWAQLSEKFKVSRLTIAKHVRGLTGRKAGAAEDDIVKANKALAVVTAEEVPTPSSRVERLLALGAELRAEDPTVANINYDLRKGKMYVGRLEMVVTEYDLPGAA